MAGVHAQRGGLFHRTPVTRHFENGTHQIPMPLLGWYFVPVTAPTHVHGYTDQQQTCTGLDCTGLVAILPVPTWSDTLMTADGHWQNVQCQQAWPHTQRTDRSSQTTAAVNHHHISAWSTDHATTKHSGEYKDGNNCGRTRDSFDLPNVLSNAVCPFTKLALQRSGPRCAANPPSSCKLPQQSLAWCLPVACMLQDDPTPPLTGELSSTSLLGTQGDAGHVERLESGPCCDFGNIDLSGAELQGWLCHVNDVRNLPPMPKEQLRNPTPLEVGVWVGGLQHADKIDELRRCGVRVVMCCCQFDWGMVEEGGPKFCETSVSQGLGLL